MIDWPLSLRWRHPESVHGRLQAARCSPEISASRRLELSPAGPRRSDCRPWWRTTPTRKRDDDGRRDELPGRHAGRARHHEFEPPRQAEIAGHRADQHAERQDALRDLRHAVQRDLGDQQRGDVRRRRPMRRIMLDVVEQDDQREDAEQHRDQRGEEAHAEIAVRACRDHCAGLTTVPARRANHSLTRIDGVGQEGRRLDDQAARDREQARRRSSPPPRRTGTPTAIGYFTAKTVQAKPIRRSAATREDHRR